MIIDSHIFNRPANGEQHLRAYCRPPDLSSLMQFLLIYQPSHFHTVHHAEIFMKSQHPIDFLNSLKMRSIMFIKPCRTEEESEVISCEAQTESVNKFIFFTRETLFSVSNLLSSYSKIGFVLKLLF